jgi:sugar phosphate isomerase/epimerase
LCRLWKRIAEASPWSALYHVADSNRWYPGAGRLDFAFISEALYATGYEGHFSGEFMPWPDADTSAREGIAYLRRLGLS